MITLDPIYILVFPLYFLPQLRQLPRGGPLHSVGLASIEVRLRVLSGSGSGGGVVGGSNGVQGVQINISVAVLADCNLIIIKITLIIHFA